MKSVPKLIRRFVSIMFLSSVLLIILNFIFFRYAANYKGIPIAESQIISHMALEIKGVIRKVASQGVKK